MKEEEGGRRKVKTMEINWQNLFTDYKAKLKLKKNLTSEKEEEGGGRREEGGRTIYNEIAPSNFVKHPIFESPSFRRLFTSYLEEKTDFQSLLKLKNFPNLYKYDEESPKKIKERDEEEGKEDGVRIEGGGRRREVGFRRKERGGIEQELRREEGGGKKKEGGAKREEGGGKIEEGGGKREEGGGKREEGGGKREDEAGSKEEGGEQDERRKTWRRKSIIGGVMLMTPNHRMNGIKKTSTERFDSLRNLIKARVQYKREIRSTDSEKTADLLNPRFLQKFYSIYQVKKLNAQFPFLNENKNY